MINFSLFFSSFGWSAMEVNQRGSSGVLEASCSERILSFSGISACPSSAPGTAQAQSSQRAWVPLGGAWGYGTWSRTFFLPFPFLIWLSPSSLMKVIAFCWLMVVDVKIWMVV